MGVKHIPVLVFKYFYVLMLYIYMYLSGDFQSIDSKTKIGKILWFITEILGCIYEYLLLKVGMRVLDNFSTFPFYI